MHLNLALPYIR